jgi:hypothetical protein
LSEQVDGTTAAQGVAYIAQQLKAQPPHPRGFQLIGHPTDVAVDSEPWMLALAPQSLAAIDLGNRPQLILYQEKLVEATRRKPRPGRSSRG